MKNNLSQNRGSSDEMIAEKVFEFETGLSAGLLNSKFFIFVFTELPKNAGIHFFLSLI